MYAIKKTAQMRLTATSHTRELAHWERPPIGRPILHKPYAKKRREERKHVRTYIPKRPFLETLIPSIERNYLIKAIDQWNEGGENTQ